MKGFTFYSNYYELIKYLPNEDRLVLYDTIMKYMFEDEATELNGLIKGIWINLKMPLDTSKNNAGRGGRKPKDKTETKPIKNRLKTERETDLKTNNISYFLFLISNKKYKYINKDRVIYKTILEWLEYKKERKETYKEKGLETLLTQIDSQCELYGEELVVSLINECMASNYKGIIFDKLKNKPKQDKPKWLGELIEKESTNSKEQEELELMMKEFK